MTLDQAMTEAVRAIDSMADVLRADAKALLVEHGASEAEITAALQDQEVTWLKERAQMLSRLGHELAE